MKEFELKRVYKECFEDFYAQLLESFIPEEIRSSEDALKMLDNPDFILYNISVDNRCVGYISVWTLDEITFVEHFVMKKEERGNGYGERTVKEIAAIHKSLVLECEPRDDEIKTRRAAFYERCGFRENPVDYVQPSYRVGYSEVKLILMSYPDILKRPEETIKEIYKKVYGR